MKERVVVIDDDIEFLEITWTWLENSGYEALTAENGIEGLRRVYRSRPNLVLLDANMPKMDGWEVCRRIRDMTDVPIIMITVNGQTRDLLRGFDLGVDDYITKPVNFEELIARVRAVLRRSQSIIQSEKSTIFHKGELEIDWRSHQVYVRGRQVKLSPTEFRVLSCLVKNQGWTVTHEQLLQNAWGSNYIGDKSFVKLYIRYLRQKIERDSRKPRLIITERGVGYRFSSQEEKAIV